MDTMDFIKTQKLENYESHLLIKGDIKEMYSNLPHEEIKKAVNWVIACYQRTIKEENISIKLRGKIETTTGEFKGKISGQFKQLSIKEIREITMYDLENAYLRVGTFVLQQCKGIPMGSPLSPMLAILYCARIESYFLNTLTTNIRFNSIRYIDDIFIILSGRKKDMKEGKIDKLTQ